MNNSKLWSVISYITWIGWIIAYIKGEKNDKLVLRHLNQALALNVLGSLAGLLSRWGGLFRFVGVALDIGCLVLLIMGLARAAKGSDQPLPVIGNVNLLG